MLIISDTHFNIIEKSGQVLDRPIIVKGGALVQSGAPRSKAYARKRTTLLFGVAYPPNIFSQINALECKHSSHSSAKICLALN